MQSFLQIKTFFIIKLFGWCVDSGEKKIINAQAL